MLYNIKQGFVLARVKNNLYLCGLFLEYSAFYVENDILF